MANYTDNYDLILPNENENYDVQVANTNNIAIDRILKSKIDKINGKDLSTNDFTNLYKKKLDALTMPYKYIDTVNSYSNLPSTSINGYIYGVTETNTSYIWNGTEWIDLGDFIDFSELVKEIALNKYAITTSTTIPENTDYTIPCNYKVGADVLDIYYMGERLIKGTHYIEVGSSGSISNKIQFYNWGQSVPSGRTIEFVVRGVYDDES